MIIRKDEGKTIMLGPDRWLCQLTGDETNGRFDFIEGEVGYLQGPPLHLHREQDDTIMVLDGKLKVQSGEDLFDLEAGDVFCAKPGTPHTFTNLDKEKKARILTIMTPGNFDRALVDLSRLTPEELMSEKLFEVAETHNVEITGPPLSVKLGLA